MKRLFATIFFCLTFAICSFAQTPTEPEFIGETCMLREDGSIEKLEKSTIQEKTRLNASAMIVGIGSYKTKIMIDGDAAKVRMRKGEGCKLIVRAVDNNTDPMSIISIFKFDVHNKKRKAEIASVNTFGSVKKNKLDYMMFTANKYGTSSYLIELTQPCAGEFGIIVNNPNALDERAPIVSLFAIDDDTVDKKATTDSHEGDYYE